MFFRIAIAARIYLEPPLLSVDEKRIAIFDMQELFVLIVKLKGLVDIFWIDFVPK